MPFDPDKFLAETDQVKSLRQSSFDPDAFLADYQEKPNRALEAGVEGFGEAATFGYLPQLQAGAEKLVEFFTPESAGDKAIRELGIKEEKPTYEQTRDYYSKRGQELQEAHPVASMTGQLAGGVASGIAMAPLTGGATGLTKLQRVGQAAKTGALTGLIYNPGETEDEVSPFQIKERLKNAATGAITGTIAQGGAEAVGALANAVRKIPDSLKRYSEVKSFKASGAMLKDFRKQYGRKKVNDIGRSMIDYNIVAMGDDVADIAKKSEIMKSDIGQKIGDLYQQADDILLQKGAPEGVRLDAQLFAAQMSEDLQKRQAGKVGGKSVINKINNYLDEIYQNGDDLTFQKWKEVRSSIDDFIDFAKVNEPKPVEKELIRIRNRMQEIAQENLGKLDSKFGGDRLSKIRKLNKDFSNLSDVAKMAKDKMAREESNAAFGLRERIQGGVGATVGGMVGGVPGAVVGGLLGSTATKAARQYGTPIVARSADKIGTILEKNPNLLGKFADPLISALQNSPKEFAMMLTNFMQDPEFKKKINKKKIQPVSVYK